MLDRYGSIWAKNASPIPCGLVCDQSAVEPYSCLRDVPVAKYDYHAADEVDVAMMGIIDRPPSDDDPPISDIDEWTDPGSATNLR
jgi:hypothetical protein